MGNRDIYCGGCQNLEMPQQLLPQKNPAIRAIGDGAVTQGQTKSEGRFTNVTPSGNRPGFLLGTWVAEQERLFRDSESTANSKRQHALFAEHLLVSMLCAEELQLPEKTKNTETEPETPKWAVQRQVAEVPAMDQVSAVLPDEGQMAAEPYGGQNCGGCCKGSDSTEAKG